jgi:PqqD family protein of HPr-rel-A system
MYRLAGQELKWVSLDNIHIVYQYSSAETHVFNETTASILGCLQSGPLSLLNLRMRTESDLGLVAGEHLAAEDFSFAINRLEELGLIESMVDSSVGQ